MVSDESQSSATYQQPQFGRALHLAFASRTDLHTSVLESQPDAAPNHCEADARLTAQASESCPNVGRPVKQGGNHRQRVVETMHPRWPDCRATLIMSPYGLVRNVP